MRCSFKSALVTLALATSGAATAGQDDPKETIEYTYDQLGRLVAVKHSGMINAGQAHSICYDPAGNREIYKSSSTGVLATCPVVVAAATTSTGTNAEAAAPDTSGGDGEAAPVAPIAEPAVEPQPMPLTEAATPEAPGGDGAAAPTEPIAEPALEPEAMPLTEASPTG